MRVKNLNISPNSKVACLVSGGVDSMVLLELLSRESRRIPFELTALHFNYHLRGEESDRDEAFVRDEARKRGISSLVFQEKIEKGSRVQETAREIRLRRMIDLAGKNNWSHFFMGHHADDQAETVIMRLMRGAGLRGLRGMEGVISFRIQEIGVRSQESAGCCRNHPIVILREKRPNNPTSDHGKSTSYPGDPCLASRQASLSLRMTDEFYRSINLGNSPSGGKICKLVRPLLSFTREEILSFAEKEGIAFVEDSSNLKDDYLRNRVRHFILPELKKEFPEIVRSIGKGCQLLREENLKYEEMARDFISRGNVFFSCDKYFTLPEPVRFKVIDNLMRKTGFEKEVESRHFSEIEGLLGKGRPVTREYGKTLFISRYGEFAFKSQVAGRATGVGGEKPSIVGSRQSADNERQATSDESPTKQPAGKRVTNHPPNNRRASESRVCEWQQTVSGPGRYPIQPLGCELAIKSVSKFPGFQVIPPHSRRTGMSSSHPVIEGGEGRATGVVGEKPSIVDSRQSTDNERQATSDESPTKQPAGKRVTNHPPNNRRASESRVKNNYFYRRMP